MKNTVCTAIGLLGGWIASALGGWDAAMQNTGVLHGLVVIYKK